LIALGNRDCFDWDQLRMRGTDETEKQYDETNGPEAGGRHKYLDGEGSL